MRLVAEKNTNRDLKVRNVWPSNKLAGKPYPMPAGEPNNNADEPHAIRCAQCGQPLKHGALDKTCWECGNDNVLGLKF
jgi:hypothetical protein